MRTLRRMGLACTIMLLALASIVSGASASTELTTAPGGAITASSVGPLTFELEGGFVVECNVTIGGTLTASALRIAGGTMGSISTMSIAGCSAGEIERSLLARPWTITSSRALTGAGTLPENYTGLLFTIRGFNWRFAVFLENYMCLYQGDLGLLTALTRSGAARYTTGNARALESVFRYQSGTFGCPASATVAGVFRLTQQTVTFS